MPTTATGTAYTVYSETLPTHGECVWAVADSRTSDTGIPAILYAHGAGGAADQFATLGAWTGLRDWIIDNGWAWVEGSGGATTGAQNWGNAEAQAAYPAYLAHAESVLDLGEVVLLGRSMGGLVTAWLYAQYSGRDRFSGWINNSGVSTLFVGTVSDPDHALRPSGQYFSGGTYPAYGVSNYAELEAAAVDHAPESWPASVWAGKVILNCYGDEDLTVPWTPRGAKPLRDIWAGQPASDQVSLRVGGDHTGANGSYLDVATMTDFLASIGGGEGPSEPVISRVLNVWLYIGGERYAVTF